LMVTMMIFMIYKFNPRKIENPILYISSLWKVQKKVITNFETFSSILKIMKTTSSLTWLRPVVLSFDSLKELKPMVILFWNNLIIYKFINRKHWYFPWLGITLFNVKSRCGASKQVSFDIISIIFGET
jgi:hypothetical protein